jgi:3-methylcrotonyl-CoA carboxylase alpha subunit
MPLFSSLLIANRGEIACRIIKTARRLGVWTIAVHSEADVGARHVALADEAHLIGPPPARESYLVIERIIATAKRAGAAAIHPGYGFLSERAEFAEACAAAGIVFVGPPPSAIRAMGLKGEAKALMQKARVPVVPGYHGERQEPDFLREKAYEIGYPVLIKAVAGGGGKGMRRVDRVIDFDAALEGAVREAINAFGDGRVLVEKYVAKPRHVEIQVFADSHGNAVSLFERDCSLQRRHQKVIEEAPAPGMTAEMRAAMGAAACAAAQAVGYVGAGTVEFIADSSKGLRPDGFYFMEMNTRLQVEHPVTEAITGLDLVEAQLRVAAGEPLPFTAADLAIDGHAIEARLYAEDPERGFLPSTGRIWHLTFPEAEEGKVAPEGLRIDTGVRAGDMVSPFYDPMIAKVIAHGRTRTEALDRLARALKRTEVVGPKTNAAFLTALVEHPEFRQGRFDTGFIDAHLEALGAVHRPPSDGVVAAGVRRLLDGVAERADALAIARSDTPSAWLSPWETGDAFQLTGTRRIAYPVVAEGETRRAVVSGGLPAVVEIDGRGSIPDANALTVAAGEGVYVLAGGRQAFLRFPDAAAALDVAEHGGDGLVKAPMHGKVTALFVTPGQEVAKGDKLLIVEAMKMEHAMVAPVDAVVAQVLVAAGDQVPEGARLVALTPKDAS